MAKVGGREAAPAVPPPPPRSLRIGVVDMDGLVFSSLYGSKIPTLSFQLTSGGYYRGEVAGGAIACDGPSPVDAAHRVLWPPSACTVSLPLPSLLASSSNVIVLDVEVEDINRLTGERFSVAHAHLVCAVSRIPRRLEMITVMWLWVYICVRVFGTPCFTCMCLCL